MNIKYKHWILIILLTPNLIYSAAFNHPNSLINIPIVESFNMGEFEYSTSVGVFDAETNEFDIAINYAVTNRLKVGLTIVNSSQIVGNMHVNFFDITKSRWLGMGAGVLNMSKTDKISSWDDYDVLSSNSYSPYFVSKVRFGGGEIHLGYGKRGFQLGLPGDENDVVLDGLFAGYSFNLLHMPAMIEFDGKDYNAGVRIPITPFTDFYIAVTELFVDGGNNPNYNNAPVRYFTMAFRYRKNILNMNEENEIKMEERLKKLDNMAIDLKKLKRELKRELSETQKERDKLSEEVGAIKKAIRQDNRYINIQNKEDKESLRRHYLGVNQEIGERVINLYYQAFEHYYQKEYMEAIEAIQKAIVLDPYMPQLYIRLGSIYFDLGMPKEAIFEYEKALKLDPYNQELLEMISTTKKGT